MFSFSHTLSDSLFNSSFTKIFLLFLILKRIILSGNSKNCIFFIIDNTTWISIDRMRLRSNCYRITDIRIVHLLLICKKSIHCVHAALTFHISFIYQLSLLVKFHAQIVLLVLKVLYDLLTVMYFQLVNWKDIIDVQRLLVICVFWIYVRVIYMFISTDFEKWCILIA